MGSIIIDYVPDAKIIELKSLKLYLLQYRNVGIFYENIVNRILEDLIAAIAPRFMRLTADLLPTMMRAAWRGGRGGPLSVSFALGPEGLSTELILRRPPPENRR